MNEVCNEIRFEKYQVAVSLRYEPCLKTVCFIPFRVSRIGRKHIALRYQPAFGPLGIRNMFDDILAMSLQMVLKLDRLGPNHAIKCNDDLTRLGV